MKKLYYLFPIVLGATVVLSACGASKNVLTEAKEALKEAKGMEMETSLTTELRPKEGGEMMKSKIFVQEERDLESQILYRSLNFDTPEGTYDQQHYVEKDGTTYVDFYDGSLGVTDETNYQSGDYLYDLETAYVNVDMVLEQMLEVTKPLWGLLGNVDSKEEDGVYTLTLESLHEKVENPDELIQSEPGSDLSLEVKVYDMEVIVNAETSLVEKVMITLEMDEKQGDVTNEVKVMIESDISIVDDVNIEVSQEVLDMAEPF